MAEGATVMKRLLSLLVLVSVTAALGAPAAVAQEEPVEMSWGAPGELAVSPDGAHLYATGRMRTMAFARDPETFELRPIDNRIPGGNLIALGADGAFVYIGDEDRLHVLRRDPASGRLTFLHTLSDAPDSEAPLARISGIVPSPDGTHLYVTSRGGDAMTVFRIAPNGSLEVHQLLFGGPGLTPGLRSPNRPALSPDGRFLYVAGLGETGILERDAATELLRSVGSGPEGSAGVVPPDGARYYSGVDIFTRDVADGQLTYLTYCRCYGRAPLVSPDSRTLYHVVPHQRAILQTPVTPEGIGPVSRTYKDGQDGVDGISLPEQALLSPDGRSLYVVGSNPPGDLRTNLFGQATIAAFRRSASNDLEFAGDYEPKFMHTFPGTPATASVNDGAIYTRDLDVTVTVTCPYGDAGVLLSNQPDMSEARAVPATDEGRYPWTLADNDGQRDVRRVYARCVFGESFRPDVDALDDIIVDRRRPEVTSLTLRGRLLRVRARDNRALVGLQATPTRRRRGVLIRFARRTELPHRYRRLWVRVLDGAGNFSRWHKVVVAPRRATRR